MRIRSIGKEKATLEMATAKPESRGIDKEQELCNFTIMAKEHHAITEGKIRAKNKVNLEMAMVKRESKRTFKEQKLCNLTITAKVQKMIRTILSW